MKLELRPYQKEAVQAIIDNKDTKSNDIVMAAVGAGKSLIIADAAFKLGVDVLILSPSREITEQNKEKMEMYVDKELVGVYSASFKSKEIRKFTFATIQSIYKQPEKFQHFKYIFIDECHATTEENKLGSMFISFISKLDAKIFGFTATPYRVFRKHFPQPQGVVKFEMELKVLIDIKYIWDNIIYCINYRDLLEQGYLVPVREITAFKNPKSDVFIGYTYNGWNPRFIQLLQRLANGEWRTLVFTKNLKQADDFLRLSENAAIVDGKTKIQNRINILKDFKDGPLRMLFNYEALLTGFDNSSIGVIVLFREFSSLNQYVQALGRGSRLHEGKKECIVLDFGKNIKKHGMPQDVVVKQVDGKWGVYSGDKKLNDKKETIFFTRKKKFRK